MSCFALPVITGEPLQLAKEGLTNQLGLSLHSCLLFLHFDYSIQNLLGKRAAVLGCDRIKIGKCHLISKLTKDELLELK